MYGKYDTNVTNKSPATKISIKNFDENLPQACHST